MRRGRPKAELVLSKSEQERLESMARRSRSAPHLARRARIILKCAEEVDNQTVAHKLRVTPQMVGKWRARFVSERLEGLHDEPRTGAPRQVADAQVEDVIVRTLESTPRGATHWSTRSMAVAAGMSRMTVQRIWKAFGLQPHRSTTFKLSPDPLLIEKVRDIVGLYIDPPEHALVLCLDEKSQIQALDRTQPLLPMHHLVVCCSGGQDLPRYRPDPSPASLGGVPQVPRSRGSQPPGGSRHPCHHGQLRHPQDCADPALVCQAAPLSRALHPDLRLVVESGRALVCRAYQQADSPRLASQPPRTGTCDRGVPRSSQSRAAPV